jgi:hypothetical protein
LQLSRILTSSRNQNAVMISYFSSNMRHLALNFIVKDQFSSNLFRETTRKSM